jgi:subtilisin family serine protease
VRPKSFIFAALITLSASAQLPRVSIPQVQLPPVAGDATRNVGSSLRGLADTHALRIDSLFREHRAELDRDPVGDLVVRAEIIAIDVTDVALDRALAENFLVKRTTELADLGVRITVLQTPDGWSATRGLRRLRKLDPQGSYDFNHVYLDGGERAAAAPAVAPTTTGAGSSRVGLIDGGVDTRHKAFAAIGLKQFGCEGSAVPSLHGTAVASLLVRGGGIAELFAADVYCGQPTGGAVDSVAAAFGWMAREQVAVINVSLVGPRNVLLERVVKILVARGHLIVAAVGNDGPAAPPLYPASYAGVVGVTAVDKNHRVLIEACRGAQVHFAAQGADLDAASNAPDQYSDVRGTSFAAPIVSTTLAMDLTSPDPVQAARVLAKWNALARDLGKHGRDDVYGLGELGATSVAP